MFWRKVFVAAQTGQLLLPASSSKNLLDLKTTNLQKVSAVRLQWSKFFSKKRVSEEDKEFLFLQAHLVDLLELNIELFERRRRQYKNKRNSVRKMLSGDSLLMAERFFAEDLTHYSQRKNFLIENSFKKISMARDMHTLLEIKAYLISNVALISYKTKKPYYF